MEFNGKLITDANLIKEPQGSWVNAWNVVLDKGFTSLKNEDGFELKVITSFTIIGRVATPVGIVVFSVNLAQTISRIEIFDPVANTLTLILQSNTTIPTQDCGLNFHLENPIEAVYKFNFRQQLIVAFWDGIKSNSNKPRMINLNNLPFAVDGSKLITAAEKTLGKSDLISLFPDLNVPIFNFTVKNGGGLIDAGAVYFTIAYFIDETDITNWINFEVPVYITNYNYDTDSTLSKEIDKVNKSIIINFSQLDQKFKYFKIGVVNKLSTGAFPRIVGKYDIPVGGNKKVIFNGTFDDEIVSLDDIIVPTDSYEKIKTGTNFNGQLVVGNTTSRSVLQYQPYANNIKLEWRWGSAGKIHRDLVGQDFDTAKNGNFTDGVHANKTFMPDEVYAFYIHWILKTGQMTEGYHIPGRLPTVGNERDLISAIGIGEEIYIDNSGGSNAKRFHTRDTNIYAGAQAGAFGFWENEDEVYPTTNDFLVLNVDGSGNPTAPVDDFRGQKVRHHKFPANIWDGNELLNLGVVAANVKIPASMLDKVQGYVISYAIREGTNKTILGTSPLFNYGNTEGTGAVAGTLIPLNKSIRFYDYKLLNDQEQISPSYLKTVYQSPAILVGVTEGRYGDTGNCNVPVLGFYKVNDYNYIPENNSAAAPTNKFREAYLQLKTYSDIPNTEFILQESATPFTTLHIYNLCAFILNIYQSFYTQEVAFTNFVFKTTPGTYDYSGNIATVIYNGDSFTSNPKIKTYVPDVVDVAGIIFISAVPALPVGSVGVTLTTYYLWRSQLYYSYRVEKQQDKQAYPLYVEVLDIPNGETFNNKIGNPAISFNHYEYNRVYSSVNNLKKIGCYNPFITFIEELPFRIPVSNRYQSEAQTNNWRKFTTYFEMPNNKGEVWVLNSSDRIIYIQMKYSLYITAIKDKMIGSGDGDDTTVGITSIFDRPPEEIIIENAGYIGCQSQWAAFVCKHGYIVADKQRGKIFVYSEGANEITRVDNFNFFEKNLEASTAFVNSDNPFLGKGLLMSYNDKDNILVITKNYELDTNTKSFTISYNFDRKGFISRHSYISNALMYDRKNMYSIKTVAGVSTIYKHNHKLNKAIYYIVGTPHDSYVDVILNVNNDINKSFGSFNWKTEVKNLVDKATQFSKTATHVIVYNEVQCSGLIPLITAQSAFTGNNARQLKGTWHFNSFRDAVVNSGVAFFDDDLNVITGNFNFNKNWFDKSKFFGKFIALRLIYNNVDQKEFTINSIDVTQKLNNRN